MKINIQELDEGFRFERKEEFQQLRVEKPFFLLHDAQRLFRRICGAIPSRTCERIVGIYNSKDAGLNGNVFPFDLVGVAGAIIVFVMIQNRQVNSRIEFESFY